MASPAPAAPTDFTQLDAARQSLIAISQSVPLPEVGAPVFRPPKPNGGGSMDEKDVSEQRYRAKLISISNQSPDARPTPSCSCPPNNGGAERAVSPCPVCV